MNQIQAKLLSMMKIFHNFCEENNITYYIIGGTLLGAIRHEGFIPWDDDIDVIIPRDDYNKLFLLKDKLPNELTILTKGYKNESGTFSYQKLVDKKTTLIENNNEMRIMGIYIDIFPLDGAAKTYIGSKIKYIKIKGLIYLLWFNGTTKDNPRISRKVFIKIAKCFENRKIYRLISKKLSKSDWNKNYYCGNFMGAYGFTEILPSSYYGKPQLYKFENTLFYGPEKATLYLEHIYGENYNQLPPVDKRFSHHEYEYLNLDEPFANYYERNFASE